jgi:hypothetical protein
MFFRNRLTPSRILELSRGSCAGLRGRSQLLQSAAQKSLKCFGGAVLSRSLDSLLGTVLVVAKVEERGNDVAGSACCRDRLA